MCNFRTSKLLLNCAVPEEGDPPPRRGHGVVLAPGAAPGAAGGRWAGSHGFTGMVGGVSRPWLCSLSVGKGLLGGKGLSDSPLLTSEIDPLQYPSIARHAFNSSPRQGLLLLTSHSGV